MSKAGDYTRLSEGHSVTVSVRRATPADEGAALELMAQLQRFADNGQDSGQEATWRAGFRQVLGQRERATALVATDDSRLLGLITISFNLAMRYGGLYAQIEELIVHERVRGQHLGSLLVNAGIEASREIGCREIGLYALERNRPFYEKLGFEYAGPELRQAL